MGVSDLFRGQKGDMDLERSYGAAQNPFFSFKQQVIESLYGDHKKILVPARVRTETMIKGPIYY